MLLAILLPKKLQNFYITKLKKKTQNPNQDSKTNHNSLPNNTPIYEGRDKMKLSLPKLISSLILDLRD